MQFNKIHACGNDFILLDETPNRTTIKAMCDRHHGIGADGVMVYHSTQEGSRLEHFDPDGSFSFCLNGTRATIHCLFKRGIIPKRGILSLGDRQIPYQVVDTPMLFLEKAMYSDRTLETTKGEVHGFFVHVGNPHFIIENLDSDRFMELAPEIRHHAIFPRGTNVHLLKSESNSLYVSSYERGVEGCTLSCGSGSLAVACMLFQRNHLEKVKLIQTDGSHIQFDAKGPLIAMHGEVAWVAKGEWLCS